MVEFIGLEFVDSSDAVHRFGAPYSSCKNQLDVAFGGAIATGLTLAGWFSLTQAAESITGSEFNPMVARAEFIFSAPHPGPELTFLSPVTHLSAWQGRLRHSMTTHLSDPQGHICAQAYLTFVL